MTRKYTRKTVVNKENPVNPDRVFLKLKLGVNEISSEGDTALEALTSMERPTKIFTKGLLTVRQGERSRELPLTLVRVKRLFYPLAQRYIAKQLIFGLK
jgi:hypothetical protein